jgi:hypothetical protein
VWSGRCFGETYCLHAQGRSYSKEAMSNKLVGYLPGLLFYPEEGGRPFLRSVGKHIPDYTAPRPRRQFFSYTRRADKSLAL